VSRRVAQKRITPYEDNRQLEYTALGNISICSLVGQGKNLHFARNVYIANQITVGVDGLISMELGETQNSQLLGIV
jgi:hypothetical protein